MRHHPRHRAPSRRTSAPSIAAATAIVAAATAVVTTNLPGQVSEASAVEAAPRATAVAAPPQVAASQVAASRDKDKASRSSARTAPSAATMTRLLRPVAVPGALLTARPIDSAATRTAKAGVASARTTEAGTRATLQRTRTDAVAKHRAWAQTVTEQTRAVQQAAGGRPAGAGATAPLTASGAVAAIAGPAVRAQDATAAAHARWTDAESALADAVVAQQRAVDALAAAQTRASGLADADTRRVVADGSFVALADGQVVRTVRPGTAVVGNGHTVTPQISRQIGEALGLLYAAGFPRGEQDAENLAIIIYNESGGDVGVVNTYDRNAAAGTPSFGLMQTIGPTFDAFALPTRTDRRDPVAQIMAGARYAQATYGGLAGVPGVKSLRGGGPYLPY